MFVAKMTSYFTILMILMSYNWRERRAKKRNLTSRKLTPTISSINTVT